MTRILSDSKGIFADTERFRKLSGVGQAPRDKATRERRGQDEHPETLAGQAAFQMGGVPTKCSRAFL